MDFSKFSSKITLPRYNFVYILLVIKTPTKDFVVVCPSALHQCMIYDPWAEA